VYNIFVDLQVFCPFNDSDCGEEAGMRDQMNCNVTLCLAFACRIKLIVNLMLSRVDIRRY
jgi:hypothetical protein